MKACIPVTDDDATAPGWGRAYRVAVADVSDGRIVDWRTFVVGWDTAHDEGPEGTHHARVARFLIDQRIDVVVAQHMGPGMTRMLAGMGLGCALGAGPDARAAVLAAAQQLA
jgi:predicted Fe-Mo cluster-binding NifX family protein